jgi:hypothetical protein
VTQSTAWPAATSTAPTDMTGTVSSFTLDNPPNPRRATMYNDIKDRQDRQPPGLAFGILYSCRHVDRFWVGLWHVRLTNRQPRCPPRLTNKNVDPPTQTAPWHTFNNVVM